MPAQNTVYVCRNYFKTRIVRKNYNCLIPKLNHDNFYRTYKKKEFPKFRNMNRRRLMGHTLILSQPVNQQIKQKWNSTQTIML